MRNHGPGEKGAWHIKNDIYHTQSTISAIENDRVKLGVERAKILATALKVHPGVLVFPGWELPEEVAAC